MSNQHQQHQQQQEELPPKDYGWIKMPQESSSEAVKFAEFIHNSEGVPFGIDMIDSSTLPAVPGDVIAFIGLPGHCKSALLTAHCRNAAKRIYERREKDKADKKKKRVALYCTWEQTTATQEIHLLSGNGLTLGDIVRKKPGAKEELKTRIAQQRHKLPVLIAGYSFDNATTMDKPMYISSLHQDILRINREYDYEFESIYFDYLQIAETDGDFKFKNLQIAQAIKETKKLAMAVKCPIYLGVQAKIDVLKRQGKEKMPGIGDTYYSSELGHVIDKGFGLLKFSKAFEAGQLLNLEIRGNKYPTTVTNQLFGMHKFKERNNDGDRHYYFDFDVPNYSFSKNEDFALCGGF